MTIAVGVENLSFHWPDGTVALEDINLSLEQGQFAALLASNGSGKTTLLRIIAGVLEPTRGRAIVMGQDVRRIPARKLYRHLGIVLQNPDDQLFAMTVEQDVAYGPTNLDLPAPEVHDRVAEALHAVGAEHLSKRSIHHLSFGERKRVALAGVLAMGTSILLLDEPTAGLDPSGEMQMLRLLAHLNRNRSTSILMATHAVDLLPLIVDRVAVLHRGRLLREGCPQDVFDKPERLNAAELRLPYVAELVHQMREHDGLKVDKLPLTIEDARQVLSPPGNCRTDELKQDEAPVRGLFARVAE